MNHQELVDRVVSIRANASREARDTYHPHASEALMCPRRNVIGWLDQCISKEQSDFKEKHLSDELRRTLQPEEKVPGVFTVGHMFDKWAKGIYRQALWFQEMEDHIDFGIKQIGAGTPRIFTLPGIPGDVDFNKPIDIAGEYDMLVQWGANGEFFDLLDYKTCKTLYMYEKKGPSAHHIAQISVYAWGLMYELFGDKDGLMPSPEKIAEFKRAYRLILMYIAKNDAALLTFEVQLFPLRSLHRYFSMLNSNRLMLKHKVGRGETITSDCLPVAQPSFDWECKWKTGACRFYEDLCRKEQDELKGTVERAKTRSEG